MEIHSEQAVRSTGLVVFGEDWGQHPSSTQHIVGKLAADRSILWVNSIGLRRPRLDRRDLWRLLEKLGKFSRPEPQPAERVKPSNIDVVAPIAVPWPGSRLAAAVNARVLTAQLLPRIAKLQLDRPLLWTSLPTALPLVGRLGERAVVYYCGDDFGSLAGVDGGPVMAMERELVARADLIIAASEVLASRFPPRKTLHVPHGADVALFAKAAPPARDLPTGRPVAGFYGSLSEWIDVELIATAAETLPEWAFVLIGPVRIDVGRLRSLGNVTLLGPRSHHELPGYSQHWSVSMMPFRACPQIHACNPLKLREYLAAGRPVVSTEFPAVLRYQNVVNITRTPQEFIGAIRQAGCGDGDTLVRQTAVASETWDARAAEIDRALSRL